MLLKMQSGDQKKGGKKVGKLEEKSDGYYILEAQIGCLTIKKAFQEANKPLDEISKTPKPDGFYLNIPDIKSTDKD